MRCDNNQIPAQHYRNPHTVLGVRSGAASTTPSRPASMEAPANDAQTSPIAAHVPLDVATGLTEPETHSRQDEDVDDIVVEVSPVLAPTTSDPSSSSPRPPAQALERSMRRASRTTSTSRAGDTNSAQPARAMSTSTSLPSRTFRRASSLPTTPAVLASPPASVHLVEERRSIYAHVRTFLGHGNPARRRKVHTVFSLTLYTSQLVVSAVFIALTQIKWKSQSSSSAGRSEWDACDKPLGSMMIVWLVRCILGVGLAMWAYRRSILQ